MNRSELVAVRGANSNDKNFILATFLRGLYYGNELLNLVPKDIFMVNYHNIIEALLSISVVSIACLKEDPDTILGYSIHSSTQPTLHWVFVKSAWRNIGIGKMLVPQDPQSVSHLTKTGMSILKKHPNTVFDPFNLN